MKGTEKQVKWAEEIKARTIQTIDAGIAHIQTMQAPADKKAAVIAEQQRRRDVVSRIAYASAMIDAFQRVDPADLNKSTNIISAAFRGFEKFWVLD